MKNPKAVLVIVVVMTFLLIHTSYQHGNHANAETILRHSIYSPFGDLLENEEEEYEGGGGDTDDAEITPIVSRFRDLDSRAGQYCKIGGWYTINVYSDPGRNAMYHDNSEGNRPNIFNETFELFYCKTTLDLAKKIKIPSSWDAENDHLTLYCNDGEELSLNSVNFEILTRDLHAYKLCILKNQDRSANNTVIYGFEVGNSVIDSNPLYFFDKDNLDENHIMKGFGTDSTESGNYTFSNKNFKFAYDIVDSFFTLTDSNNPLNKDLNLSTSLTDSLSRVLILNRRDGVNAYGYETAHRLYNGGGNSIEPVYTVNLSEFSDEMTSEMCEHMLASHEDGINCDEPEKIIIDSTEFDEPKIPFNLFKNIVLNAEDDGR